LECHWNFKRERYTRKNKDYDNMKNTSTKTDFNINFLLVVLLSVMISGTSFAQRLTSEAQLQSEIDAVKSFINRVNSTQYSPVSTQQIYKPEDNFRLQKENQTNAYQRKHYLMNANRITTEVYSYGGIAPGYGLLRGVNNGVWKGLSYIFQFCPFVGASVPDNSDPTKRLKIISDGLWDYPTQAYQLREVNPTGDTLWQFQPLPGYDDENQEYMASNPAPDLNKDGKPDSWPSTWYNAVLGKYVWPGYLAQDAENADLEVFWAMDDRDNREFNYFPFPGDFVRRGLGIQIDGRGLQWSNTLAENAIFFIYTVANISSKNLDTMYFGVYGDCDVGGGSPENTDDNGLFIPPHDVPGYPTVANIPVYSRSVVYFWDPDGKGDYGLPVGYVACKYLESPGKPNDGVDNDGDLMTDESQEDNIDNDGDWNPATDDVGQDGVPSTGDLGEGDGLPTRGKKLPGGALDPLFPGEPNFEYTDLDEADQIGLSSFSSWTWPNDRVSNDEGMWNRIRAGNFSPDGIAQATDIVFCFASGDISLAAQETKRISSSLLFGEDLNDLLVTAETVQRIYNANYRFYRPPAKPIVNAIGGDKKVTLYWDSRAEGSNDPLTGMDFEGYVIYRSTDPTFSDIQGITDGKGNSFFSRPLKDLTGTDARFDLINDWAGYHPVSYRGRGIQYYLGDDRGLVHTYVDSNEVINGQTYYYAVVAYDHGDSVGVPPTETTKKITLDAITSKYEFDVNTVAVVPGPRAGGYLFPDESALALTQKAGIGNGKITMKIVNDLLVQDNVEYDIIFSDTLRDGNTVTAAKNFSVLKLADITDMVSFTDTNFYKLNHANLNKSFIPVVTDESGKAYTENSDYIIDYERGLIRRTGSTTMALSKPYKVVYRHFPISQSTLLKYEDGNSVFDGLQIKVQDYEQLIIDTIATKWSTGSTNFDFTIDLTKLAFPRKKRYPANYEVKFSAANIDSAKIGTQLGVYPVPFQVVDVTTGVPVRVWTYVIENAATKNFKYDFGEEIIFFNSGSNGVISDTLTWSLLVKAPTDSGVTPVAPTDGDVLYIRTERPFNKYDRFSFTSKSGQFSNSEAKSRLDNVYTVPNPYVGYNEVEPTNKLPGRSRGERRIYFENLPPKCTIKIYTLSGDWVQTIEHESTFDNGREYWNLLNSDGFSISYGIYFAHIDAGEIGEKLIKFAIIK